MKLRLAKGSIRLRILRSEVNALRTGARLQETLSFGPDLSGQFSYALERAEDTSTPEIRFTINQILVRIPSGRMLHWATSEEVGIYTEIETGPGEAISLLIEKDFACLDRSDAENADTFANPNSTC